MDDSISFNGFRLLIFGAIGLAFLASLAYFCKKKDERSFVELKYIVTETKGPDSFDPKDADKTQNLSVMRMLYATPLEIDTDNRLKSYVLKSFNYDETTQKLKFEVRNDLKYSDGTQITAEDVVLSIVRAAHFRPEFPVIKEIVGIQEWKERGRSLERYPSGIKIQGQVITIAFQRKLSNPLFRFCLELFSIIPKSCINLETSELQCERAPSSGYFTIEANSRDSIVFVKRLSLKDTVGEIIFSKIIFSFQSLKDACKQPIESNQVIAASEIDLLSASCDKYIKPSQVHWMPSARFFVIRFNPEVAPFNIKENRQYFAEVVRDTLKGENPSLSVEKSLFPKLLPGYLEANQLIVASENHSRAFVGIKIKLPKISNFAPVLFDSIIKAAQKLEMDVELVNEPTMGQMGEGFLNGKFPVIPGGSGFWAQDPIGDVSMWFTKNLHAPMKFIWSDEEVYRQIRSLETELNGSALKTKMEQFNRYIFDQSLISPILHARRCFISSKDAKSLSLLQAITSPAPWQLRVK
jgi:ABC-type transport system substrate-binding protein